MARQLGGNRLSSQVAIVNRNGHPTQKFQWDLNKAFAELEAQITSLSSTVSDLQATIRRDSISASFTVPTLVATAADAGSDVTITMIAHERQYGDETSVSVDGGSITGQPYSTTVAVYYDDEDREGGAVTYAATTDLKTAQNNHVAGRHYVATLTTPAAAAPPTSGGSPPPGSGYSGSGGGGGPVIP